MRGNKENCSRREKESLFCNVWVPEKNPEESLREAGISSGLFAVSAAGLGEAGIK